MVSKYYSTKLNLLFTAYTASSVQASVLKNNGLSAKRIWVSRYFKPVRHAAAPSCVFTLTDVFIKLMNSSLPPPPDEL